MRPSRRSLQGHRKVPSPATRTVARVQSEESSMLNEAHHGEVEKVLLYISEARERAERARVALTRDGAEQHLIAALEESEERLRQDHRRLLQASWWTVLRRAALGATAVGPATGEARPILGRAMRLGPCKAVRTQVPTRGSRARLRWNTRHGERSGAPLRYGDPFDVHVRGRLYLSGDGVRTTRSAHTAAVARRSSCRLRANCRAA